MNPALDYQVHPYVLGNGVSVSASLTSMPSPRVFFLLSFLFSSFAAAVNSSMFEQVM